MKAVYLKELRSYFTNVVAYACYALIFLITGIYTWAYNIDGASGSFESTISGMALWVLLIPIPLLTMRIFAEERKQKTDQLLYSLPLKSTQIVLGKYFAAITVLLIPVLIIGIYPLIFSAFGTVNFATCYSTLFAFYLVGAAFMAVGVFMSSLVENQIVASASTGLIIYSNYYMPYNASYVSETAVTSVVFLVILGTALGLIVYFMTKNSVAGLLTAAVLDFGLILFYYIAPDALEGLLPSVLGMLSLFDALDVFAGGIFDLTGIIYFLSVIVVFMFLTVQSLEKRRWS